MILILPSKSTRLIIFLKIVQTQMRQLINGMEGVNNYVMSIFIFCFFGYNFVFYSFFFFVDKKMKC